MEGFAPKITSKADPALAQQIGLDLNRLQFARFLLQTRRLSEELLAREPDADRAREPALPLA